MTERATRRTASFTPSMEQALRRVAAGLPVTDEPPDEAEFLAAIERHGLTGLAAKAVAEGLLSLSAASASALNSRWKNSRARSAALELECRRIGRLMQEHPDLSTPILLKGPTVARRYADPSMRTYVDLDLMVPASEIDRWELALTTIGYGGPGTWFARRSADFYHGYPLSRRAGGATVLVDLHRAVSVERRAMRIDYAALSPKTAPGIFGGLLEPEPDALLLILALHLTHHKVKDRRLIWIRDVIEIADAEVVQAARALASRWGVQWALEDTLAAAEDLCGKPRWDARPIRQKTFGVARVLQRESSDNLYHVALAKDLGARRGLQYLFTKVDPRRFTVNGRIRPRLVLAWASQFLRKWRTPK